MDCNRRQLISLLTAQLAAVSCSKRAIDRAPERIELTVDQDVELLGRRILREQLHHQLRRMADFDAGMVTVRNLDGAVLAYIGTLRDDVQFDNCRIGRRDLGSVGKPFILAAALQAGAIRPDERFMDVPFSFPRFDAKGSYTVHNYGDHYTGRDLDIFEALARSSNTVYTQIYGRVGPQVMRQVFSDLQLGSNFNVNLLPVGRWSAPLTNVAAAFSVFANDGSFRPARFISGRLLAPKLVFRADVCRVVSAAMSRCVTEGTGIAARDLGNSCRGKTGSASDAIAVLQTKVVTSIIWLGHTRSNQDLRMTGGQLAMPAIAGYYRALKSMRPEWFPDWSE